MIAWHAGLTMLIVWFVMRGNPRVDYRIVGVAAQIPDAVDLALGPPLGERLSRLWAHSLVLNVAVFCVLFFLRGSFKRTFVLVPISSLLHLALDAMWSVPRTFWWPLFGRAFVPDTGFLGMRPSEIAIKEAAGLAVLVWLLAAHGMLSAEGIAVFARTGRLTKPRTEATA